MAAIENCLFCKIAGGQLPANVLYQDEQFIAILDVFPITKGHTLIIPKAHTQDIYSLPAETAAALLPLAQKLARKLHDTLYPDGLNVLQNNGAAAGQSVFHFHMHLIPRYGENDGAVSQKTTVSMAKEELAELAGNLRLP